MPPRGKKTCNLRDSKDSDGRGKKRLRKKPTDETLGLHEKRHGRRLGFSAAEKRLKTTQIPSTP